MAFDRKCLRQTFFVSNLKTMETSIAISFLLAVCGPQCFHALLQLRKKSKQASLPAFFHPLI
jgi:hypothetical protein